MEDTITRCVGRITQYNPLSIVPGALRQGDNCVIRRENIIENRRGFASYGSTGSAPSQLMIYSNTVLAHNGTNVSYDNGSGTFTNYSGAYTAPTSYKMRFEETTSNLFVTTNAGVKVFTNITGTAAVDVGAPRSLDPSYVLNAAGTGFLTTGNQCAYRLIITRKDVNLNLLIGYPSQRLWVTNSSGASKNIDLTIYLPTDAILNDVVQIYRTPQQVGTTTDISGDEEQLAYQTTLTAANISAGFITVTDSIVDQLLGAIIYTAPSQEGIGQANDRPPLAKDLALYNNDYLFYSNTETKQVLFFSLVGTSGLTGNTFTLAGTTYNFGATEIVSGGGSPQVAVSATGIAATDIDFTARSFVRVINRYASNTTVYAYYLSGANDLPGKIMIQARTVGGATFAISASNATISPMVFPNPPTSGSTTESTSTNDKRKNALFYSKTQQPQHVPALNYLPVGPSNKEILRIIALRDSLIIIKEEGVYKLTGVTPQSFNVSPLDLTVKCRSKNSVAVLANQVFMLSNQGIVSVSDTGVEVVSRDIEPDILPLLTLSNVDDYSYGAGYESDRTYMLSTIQTITETAPSQIHAYNIFTKTWVRWTYAFSTAAVNTTIDKFFFAQPNNVKVFKERKDFANTDYADDSISVTINSITGNTVNFSAVSGTPQVGWAIQQGTTALVISAISPLGINFVATLIDTPPSTWTTGAATIFPGVNMQVEYHSWSASQPGMMKQVSHLKILGDDIQGNTNISSLIATFRTDIDSTLEEQIIQGGGIGWGDAWGTMPWGGVVDPFGYESTVPRNKQYCRLFNPGVKHINALEKLSIAGVFIKYDGVSDRTSK